MPINRSCLQCTVQFTTSMTRRIFCCERCNHDYWRDHGDECYYCGECSSSRDHIFPQTYGDGSGETVPACTQCNSILQNFSPRSHIDRVRHLLSELKRHHAKDLNRPDWTEEELAELVGGLLQSVELGLAERQRAIDRIAFLRKRLDEIVAAQVDLIEVGTETEDFEVDEQALGYLPKDTLLTEQ